MSQGLKKILNQLYNRVFRNLIIMKSEKLYGYNYYIVRKDYLSAFKRHPYLYIKNGGELDKRLK